MPKKPKKPCRYPGCPKLTDNRYCEEHQKISDANYEKYERSYAPSERYGANWKRISEAYRSRHPFCEDCLKRGIYRKTEEVHHIKPISHGGTNEESNLRSLCHDCHSRYTAKMGDRWHKNRNTVYEYPKNFKI